MLHGTAAKRLASSSSIVEVLETRNLTSRSSGRRRKLHIKSHNFYPPLILALDLTNDNMALIKLSEYCCQGGERTIDTSRFTMEDLRLAVRGNRELIFSPLGNAPVAPRVALVGITPGGQSEAFARYLRLLAVPDAAKRAAFEGAQSQIKQLLAAHGFAESIGLSLAADLNESPDIFTTSLVKCCLKVNGSYKYKAPEIAASPEAINCIANRFLADIGRFPSLEWIIIFGEPGR